MTVDTVEADSSLTHAEFVVNYDMGYYPVRGKAAFDTVSPEKIDDRTVSAELKQDGRVVLNAMRTVSKDGRTLTITYIGKTPEGKPIKNVAVFVRCGAGC